MLPTCARVDNKHDLCCRVGRGEGYVCNWPPSAHDGLLRFRTQTDQHPAEIGNLIFSPM